MFLTKQRSTLALLSPSLLLLATCVFEVHGQHAGSNAPSMHDQVRAIQTAEMDRLLLASMPPKTEVNSNRAAVMKQIRTDFKELQQLNNKMMAKAWESETLDYSYMSEMVSRIKGKATRLRLRMQLPAEDEPFKTDPDHVISNSRDFRAALLILDAAIMRFVKNPVFQTPHSLELQLATKASHDLETVISLSVDLKKTALRLSKPEPSR